MSQGVLEQALTGKRIVVCVGSGGVGKTTLSAAIALKAASQGKKVVVCTIDPARRLANSLGLVELGNVEARVSPEKFAAAGLPEKGELWAMMLDLKRSWDDLIIRNAPAERRDAILNSRFYQQLSSALAGSQEYVAMEKIVELRRNRDYDLVVLDTPPTAHALDFLDAPNRVLDFFGNEKARWLLAPALKAGEVGLRMFNLTGGYFVKTLSKLTGLELLQELAEFLSTLAPMYEVFKERAAAVKALLASSECAFVLVSSANPLTVDEAAYFHTLLIQDGMPVAAVIANRVNPLPPEAGEGELDRLASAIATDPPSDAARERIAASLEELRLLAQVDRRQIARLAETCAPTPVLQVPRMESDVYDLAGLWALDGHLFG